MNDLRLFSDTDALAQGAAAFIAQQASGQRRFSIALSGGSTPRALYHVLASPPFATHINWSQFHLFWGDERCVPPDHPDSNYRMAAETLISHVALPPENIHRMFGERPPHEGASAYEAELRAFFGGLPHFDLVLLGMGDDGHTASLFPHTPALHETTRWVVPNEAPVAPYGRLTLTAPVINAASTVLFLISGRTKAARLHEVLDGASDPQRLPAQMIHPVSGHLIWMVDAPAAQLLNPSP